MPSKPEHEKSEEAVEFDPFVPLSLVELNALIPGYEFVQFIDRGGMGAVYKAVQKSLNRMVAVKLLPPAHRNKQHFAVRFAREARALALLNHPHVVSVYDSGETTDGHMYYAMEFVTGTSLAHLLQRESLSPRHILTILNQVCDALQYAHELGVVHRDIKPANILIDERGNVKVADFGLAKMLGHDGTSSFTSTGATMGTLHYIAPEAMAHESGTDHRADIYSLGVMIYEMFTGQVPKGAWEPPSKRSGANTTLDEVVTKAMQNDPEKRFQHVSDMTVIIQKMLAHGEKFPGFDIPRARPAARKPAGPSAEAPTINFGSSARKRKRRAAFASIGIAAALAAGFFAAKQQGWLDRMDAAPSVESGPAMTAAAEQIKLADWVFDQGGFINVLQPGQTESLMGGVFDIYSAREIPGVSFSIWRISMAEIPLDGDKALDELITLCEAAGTVANLDLRAANVTPDGLKSLQRLNTLVNLNLSNSLSVTVESVPHIAACKNLQYLRIGGADADDIPLITQMLGSLLPDCVLSID